MDTQTDLTGKPARFDGALRGARISYEYFEALMEDKRVEDEALALGKRAPPPQAHKLVADNDNEPAPETLYWLGGKCRFATRYTATRPWTGIALRGVYRPWAPQRHLPPLRMQAPVASNDNTPPAWKPEGFPVKAADIPTPSARWAWLDSLPTWEESELAGTRIARLLKKDAPNAFRQLMLVSALLEPLTLVAANDNNVDDADVELTDGFGHERIQTMASIRPSIPSMLRAYADAYRPRVIVRKNGTVVRFGGDGPTWGKGIVQYGGLRFFEGQLHQIHENGKWRKPWVDVTRPATDKPIKGGATERHIADLPKIPVRHLSLRGACDWAGPPSSPAYSPSGVAITAIPTAKAEIRRQLERACEGKPVIKYPSANMDDLRKWLADTGEATAVRMPSGMARSYETDSFVSKVKGTQDGITTKPAAQALRELDRDALRQEVVRQIDPDAIDTVEDALADESFTYIGKRKGYEESSAHHGGKRAVLEALEIISEKIAA